MKTKMLIIASIVLAMAVARADYDCQIIASGIGDSNLLTLGGFTFTRPVSIDLMPTNTPNADARYSIRCQVVYKDIDLSRPKTGVELERVRETRNNLNDWLVELIADQYVGAEFGELLPKYGDGRFVEDLNDRFPAYVEAKIAALDADERINVEAVTVTVNAEGEFRAALAELLRHHTDAPQN